MSRAFGYDVFVSHSSKDKEAVREVASSLRRDGLRVWFDEWEIEPGDLISLKIEQALELSRTLVLVMSRNAFASDWVALERHTAIFRDPTNQQRRFVPLLLDDTPIPDSLRQFAYIDWRKRSSGEYGRLLAACRAGSRDDLASQTSEETTEAPEVRIVMDGGVVRQVDIADERSAFLGEFGDAIRAGSGLFDNERLELKQRFYDGGGRSMDVIRSISETVVSFLNRTDLERPAYLVIGISDSGEVVGIDSDRGLLGGDTESLIRAVHDHLRMTILQDLPAGLLIEVLPVAQASAEVLVVSVPSGREEAVYMTTDEVAYMREGPISTRVPGGRVYAFGTMRTARLGNVDTG